MRLFTAIELPDDVRTHLVALQDVLRPQAGRVSWTRPQCLHITLKFLAEVQEADVPGVCDALKDVPGAGPATLSMSHLALFPPHGGIRIVAAGVGGETDKLQELMRGMDQRLAPLGFAKERRPFIPHVTIGRPRAPLPPALRGPLAESSAPHLPGSEFVAGKFALMQSFLTPAGPEYLRLAGFIL
ncbi:MAG TPA: RNA 2',3'-cyclic phosphodiesterase [Tepidisphaeraceae bacterium]|jgi:2'-5' RNA ligase